jgi:hypothetical protein
MVGAFLDDGVFVALDSAEIEATQLANRTGA